MLKREPDIPVTAVLSGFDYLLGPLPEVWREFETVDCAGSVPHHQHGFLCVEGDPIQAAITRSYNFLKINFHNIVVSKVTPDKTCLHICLYLLICRSNTLTPPSPVTRANTVLE